MITLKNISFCYPESHFAKKEKKTVLSNLCIKIEKGDIIGLTGESGCGKSTLAKLISGIYEPDNGEIYRTCEQNHKKANPIQILFQNSENILNPNMVVRKILGGPKHNSLDKQKLLDILGIDQNLMEKRGSNLSGGERQRVALARIMLVKPELLILDEPFSAQDIKYSRSLIKLFKDIHKSFGTTIFCISHDLHALTDLCKKIFIMKDGSIIEGNNTDMILEHAENKYTKYLFDSAEFKD